MEHPILIGTIAFLALIIFLFSGIPVAIGLGLVAISGYYLTIGNSGVAPIVPFATLNSFVLTAVPLFIFMGEILLQCGISERLYRGTSRWVNSVPGGLLHSNVVSCALFAAICGSSPATAATIGTIAIPALEKRGYDTKIALGSLVAGGTLGILIPPSISLIVYGSLSQTSVGALFAGGVVPGIVMSLLFMTYIAARAIRDPSISPETEKTSVRDLWLSLHDLWPTLLIMIIVLGGIFGGMVTPTEAAALGASASFVIALTLKALNRKNIVLCLTNTLTTTCMVLFIVTFASVFSSFLTTIGTARELSALVIQLGLSKWAVIAGIYIIYILLGCFIDGLSAMIVTLPTFLPVLISFDVNLIWFGVVVTVLIEVGMITPPMGLNLFVIQGISNKRLSEILSGTAPFFFIMLAIIIIMSLFPEIVLWLPEKLTG
jgi:tripartite ATP-independent transporter DctM subunit